MFNFCKFCNATSIFYEATDVTGVGSVAYGTGANINNAPVFTFTGNTGVVDYDFSAFSPGEYTLSVTLDGFWADFNEDSIVDYTLPGGTLTSNPFTLTALPPSAGSVGQLSWDVDLNAGGWVSYDFGTTGTYTNFGVNSSLGWLDYAYSGAANGEMNADIGWNTLRVELNSTEPVPEPATMLLFGTGLLGLVGYNRKRTQKS